MSILIEGMEMPKRDATFLVHVNGDKIDLTPPRKYGEEYRVERKTYTLIPVSPHGRLIDADALYEAIEMDDKTSVVEVMHIHSIISEAPTIISASKEDE